MFLWRVEHEFVGDTGEEIPLFMGGLVLVVVEVSETWDLLPIPIWRLIENPKSKLGCKSIGIVPSRVACEHEPEHPGCQPSPAALNFPILTVDLPGPLFSVTGQDLAIADVQLNTIV